jgi:hypothetical protein
MFGEPFTFSLLLGFFIHNIPTLLLALVIWLSWSRPREAGILFLILGVLATLFFDFIEQGLFVFMLMGFPFFLIGGLFLCDWTFNKK